MSGPGYTIAKDEATGTELFVELDSRGRLELYCQHEGHGFTIHLDAEEVAQLEMVIDGHATDYLRNERNAEEIRRQNEERKRRAQADEAEWAKRQEMVDIARLKR